MSITPGDYEPCCMVQYLMFNIYTEELIGNRRPSSLSELTPIIFNMELIYFGSEAFNYNLKILEDLWGLLGPFKTLIKGFSLPFSSGVRYLLCKFPFHKVPGREYSGRQRDLKALFIENLIVYQLSFLLVYWIKHYNSNLSCKIENKTE